MRNISKDKPFVHDVPMVDVTDGNVLIIDKDFKFECDNKDNIPTGINIVTKLGKVKSVDEWTPDMGTIGLSARYDDNHIFIIGVPETDGFIDERVDDFDIRSKKIWGYTEDIKDLENNESYGDYGRDSIKNTSIIINNHPSDFITAALVCRNHETVIYKKGEWDLASGGIWNSIQYLRDDITSALDKIGFAQWKKVFSVNNVWSDDGLGECIWSSTERNKREAYSYRGFINPYTGNVVGANDKDFPCFVVPVHIIYEA